MSVMITLEMPIKSDKLDEYLGIMKQALVETRSSRAVKVSRRMSKKKSPWCVWSNVGIVLKTNKRIWHGAWRPDYWKRWDHISTVIS